MHLFDEIPGYRAALSQETEQRDAAFLQLPLQVPRSWRFPIHPFVKWLCPTFSRWIQKPTLKATPITLLPITIRRMLILEHAQSPFICGRGEKTPGAIAQFMWICSPHFISEKKKRDAFIRKCRTADGFEAIETIHDMVKSAFYDSPPREKSGGESVSYWSLAASLVDCLASEYGWTRDEILDAPLAEVLQYFKVIQHRKSCAAGDKTPLFNPSDSIKSRWLMAENEKNLKEAGRG